MAGLTGAAGKVGPRGFTGDHGVKGQNGAQGVKGQTGSKGVKGEKGEPSGSSATPMSAFSAQTEADLTSAQTIRFNVEYVDIGNDFDHTTGVFTCRIPGLYFFTYTFQRYERVNMDIQLRVNNIAKAVLNVKHSEANDHDAHSQSVILQLEGGDQVILYTTREMYILSNPQNNIFSGYLIHAI